MFNELRSDLVLLYELKQAHSNCEYEQQMLRHRYEALLKAGSGGGSGGMTGSGLAATPGGEFSATNSTTASTPGAESQPWPSADDIKLEAKEQIIDVVGAPLTPNSVSTTSRTFGSVLSVLSVLSETVLTISFTQLQQMLEVPKLNSSTGAATLKLKNV